MFKIKKHSQHHRNQVMRRDGVLVGPAPTQQAAEDPCERLAQRCTHFFSVCWDYLICPEEPEEEFDLNMLSARQLRQLRWAFNVLDEDKSGYIQGTELEQVVQLLGDNPSRSEAADLLKWIDKNNDGQVSFEEFARAWWRRPVGQREVLQKQQELEMAFQLLDSNYVSQPRRLRWRVLSPASHAMRPPPPPPSLHPSPGLTSRHPPSQDEMLSPKELRDIFTGAGEKFDEEEMQEFLGWLGLRNGGQMSVERFKRLPCWYEGEVHLDVEETQEFTEERTHPERMHLPHMHLPHMHLPHMHLPTHIPTSKVGHAARQTDLPLSLSKVDVALSESQAPAAASRTAAAAAARDWILSEEELAKYKSADC